MHVIVIGAGLSGTLTALELVKDPSVTVTLLEIGSEILPETSSSINECYRLHMGLHYAKDIFTAANCLHRSIDFARTFPQFVAGHDNPAAPWRRGRHYIMSNSLVGVEHVKEISDHLLKLYTDLVDFDPKNKVFGEPENFIRYLEPEEYTHLADGIPFYHEDGSRESVSVACAIETGESQLDLLRFKPSLQAQIAGHKQINFLPFSEVKRIEQDPQTLEYKVSAQHANGSWIVHSGMCVVNCAWQNIEKLNDTLGVENLDQHRVNRLKASILVELPVELRYMNSSIFSLGPYACMTVLPNGTAVLTSERTTNIASFKAGPGDNQSAAMCAHVESLTLATTQGQAVARKILHECADYLNPELAAALRSANILSLRLGFVKMMENDSAYTFSSIYQADSVIHTRPLEGIEIHRLGYISNAGMKMVYTLSNARTAASILQNHRQDLAARAEIVCSSLFKQNVILYGFMLACNFASVSPEPLLDSGESSDEDIFELNLPKKLVDTSGYEFFKRSKSAPILGSCSPLTIQRGAQSP